MYVRKTKSAAELSAAMSRAAKMRKHNNGGRKPKSPEEIAIGKRAVSIRMDDYDIIRRFAFKNNQSISGAIHMIASALVKNHPELAEKVTVRKSV